MLKTPYTTIIFYVLLSGRSETIGIRIDGSGDMVGRLLKVGSLAAGAAAWAGEPFSVLEHIPTGETLGGMHNELFSLCRC